MNVEELETRFQGVGKWEESSIPTAVAQRIEQTLAALPERGKQRSMAGRTRALAAAVVALVVVGGGIAGYSAYAPKILGETPIKQAAPSSELSSDVRTEVEGKMSLLAINELRDSIRKMSVKETEVSGAAVSDQGIHVRLGYVINDGYALSVRYSITADRPIQDFNLNAAIRVDGQTVGYVGNAEEDDGKRAIFRNEFSIVSATQYEGILSTTYYPFEGARMQYTDFELDISRIGNVNGEWVFDAEVRRQEPSLIIRNSNETKTSKQGVFELSKISLSKVSTGLEYAFKRFDSEKNRIFAVELTDDTGYRYGGVALRTSENSEMNYASFPSLNPEAKSLLIRPLYWDMKSTSIKGRANVESLPTPDDPLIVPIGQDKELVVTAIERRPDRTVVRSLPTPGDSIGISLYDIERGKVPLIDILFGKESGMVFEPVPSDAKLQIVAEFHGKLVYLPELEVQLNLP